MKATVFLLLVTISVSLIALTPLTVTFGDDETFFYYEEYFDLYPGDSEVFHCPLLLVGAGNSLMFLDKGQPLNLCLAGLSAEQFDSSFLDRLLRDQDFSISFETSQNALGNHRPAYLWLRCETGYVNVNLLLLENGKALLESCRESSLLKWLEMFGKNEATLNWPVKKRSTTRERRFTTIVSIYNAGRAKRLESGIYDLEPDKGPKYDHGITQSEKSCAINEVITSEKGRVVEESPTGTNEQWETIVSFSGSSTNFTEPFTIPGSEWRAKLIHEGSFFSLTLYNAYDGSIEETLLTATSPGAREIYLHRSGTFYFSIISTGNYEIIIQEKTAVSNGGQMMDNGS